MNTTQPPQREPRYWQLEASQVIGALLRWTARVWGIAVATAFMLLALRNGIPRSLEFSTEDVQTQLVFLVVILAGVILSLRWQALGASLIALGAFTMGALFLIEFSPLRAFIVTLALFPPAFLLWLDWRRTQSARNVGALALVMLLVLAAVGYQASEVYEAHHGPSHPESALTAQPVTLVEWIWSGGLGPESVTVRAGLTRDSTAVHLLVDETEDLSSPLVAGPFISSLAINERYVTFPVEGLEPDTTYHYAVEADGEVDRSRSGSFRTPVDGPFSFTFGVGGCARTGSNGSVFDTINAHDPLFFVFNGDLFYEDIAANDPALFRDAYTEILTSPAQSALYRSAPVVYAWDDHDFGPNGADRLSTSLEASQFVHRDMVPSYTMAVPGEIGPIYQAFTVGRVRFIVTDGRSEKSPKAMQDNASKSMLGPVQKEWFKQELLAASEKYPVIVWVQSVPWVGEPVRGADTWQGYTTERREIADFIADNEIEGLLMLAGDAHMLGIDDGSNSDYSTNGGAAFPILHAAALDRPGSVKGGPLSEGEYPGGGQFGLVDIDDQGGDTITVTLEGRNYLDELIVSHAYTVPADAAR